MCSHPKAPQSRITDPDLDSPRTSSSLRQRAYAVLNTLKSVDILQRRIELGLMASTPIAAELSVTSNEGLYLISTDRSKLDIASVHEWISTDCYWAIGRPFDTVKGSVEHSLPFGVYTSDSEQVGFARVVTDYRNHWIE